MARKTAQKKAAGSSMQDVAADASINRKRNQANQQANFLLNIDQYLLVVVIAWVWFATHALDSYDKKLSDNSLNPLKEIKAFSISEWFKHCMYVPLTLALHWLVVGSSDFKVDANKQQLVLFLGLLSMGIALTVFTNLALAGFKNVEPTDLIVVVGGLAIGYLHYQAAARFQVNPTTVYAGAGGQPMSKTEAVFHRVVLLVDGALMSVALTIRICAGVASGEVVSMPFVAFVGVAMVALLFLQASGSGCVHYLRHHCYAGIYFAFFLRLSVIDFIADWNTQIIVLVSYGLLALHLLLLVVDPLLRIHVTKFHRHKRWLMNFTPGEAYAAE